MAQASKADESVVKRRRAPAEQTRGMFAHVAPDQIEVHEGNPDATLSVLVSVEGDDA